MTDIAPLYTRLPSHGLPNNSWKFGDFVCPSGEVLTSIYGQIGADINGIGGTCSDGTILKYVGAKSNLNLNVQGRQSSVYGSIDKNDDMLFGVGHHGTAWTDTCPKDTYLAGYYGTYTGKTNSLGFLCNVDKNEYCVKNIDNPICSKVNTSILNKACERDMSKKECANRKDELDETLVQTYCTINPTDELCSCYADPPDFIPTAVRGTPKCWNKTCNTKGIIPRNMRGEPCNTDITICSQELSTSGDSNILSDNVNIVDCRRTDTKPPPSTGTGSTDTTSSAGTGSSTGTDSSTGTGSSTDSSGTILSTGTSTPGSSGILGMSFTTIFIILLVIIVIVVAILLSRPSTNT